LNTYDTERSQKEPGGARRSAGGAQETLGGTLLFSFLM